MVRDLGRLLRPKSIAVIGGGEWCRQIVVQCRKIGFDGQILAVHPKATEIAGLTPYPTIEDLPFAPDAVFIGINRHATIEAVEALRKKSAGGAVCFSSGFLEAEAEDAGGAELQERLLEAAGEMPILGPNCYGFINYLDSALLWPDQHGGVRTERGVAIITQSSNMAINITMQNRGLPLAYVLTAGNQAQIGISELGEALLRDDRVTALGMHIEGFGDIAAFEHLARLAEELDKPIVALKVGKSGQAQAATVSHTASLAGSDAGAMALLERLAVPRLASLPEFLECLKLLHVCGKLRSRNLASISCSGGEASLAADTAVGRQVNFPPLNDRQRNDLRTALGPMVSLANPLDYHTYIWRDTEAMTRAWSAMADPGIGLVMLIVDFPRADRCDPVDWECTINAAFGVRNGTGANVALVATLPELLPEDVADRLIQGGVVPLQGLSEAIAAAEAAASWSERQTRVRELPILARGQAKVKPELLTEAEAKSGLAGFGVPVPKGEVVTSALSVAEAAHRVGYPVVLKGLGIAHKSEAGAVRLNLPNRDAVISAAENMRASSFLVERMVPGSVAELLIGVVRDPAHGFVLTLAAGGVMTEILKDSASLMVPSPREMVECALDRLKIAPLFAGYRGGQAVDKQSVVDCVMAVQNYVLAHANTLEEIEINPLLCCTDGAVAADALIRQERT